MIQYIMMYMYINYALNIINEIKQIIYLQHIFGAFPNLSNTSKERNLFRTPLQTALGMFRGVGICWIYPKQPHFETVLHVWFPAVALRKRGPITAWRA
jgi:hypothetical protein